MSNELKGIPASPGKVRGKVLVIKNPTSTKVNDEGFILVTPFATPLMTSIIFKALAIITEIGGITSHAATIAREIGIPCVVGVTNATKILRDGEEVEVDGDRGIVKRLSIR